MCSIYTINRCIFYANYQYTYTCCKCIMLLTTQHSKHIDNSIDFTLSGKSVIMMIAYKTASIKKAVMIMEVMEMTEKEQIQKNVEEFSRLQDYMVDSDKESAAYKKMKKRYIELKVILATFGVNLTELDYIKE